MEFPQRGEIYFIDFPATGASHGVWATFPPLGFATWTGRFKSTSD